jgi:hypothetical protein
MHSSRERGRWARLRSAAVAAVALGVVSPALAQVPQAPPASTRIVGNITEFNPVSEGEARLEEMKVELALLAEPSLFSCQLQPRVDGPSLVVRGMVPNQTVRDLALKVAREHTILAVADGLTLQANLASRSGGKEADAVQKQALEVLSQYFPEHAGTFRVSAKITGEVTVAGCVPTFEDRVAVSRKLRLVDGSTCVVNQLQVPSVLHNGMPHFKVTADGHLLVPASKVVEATLALASRASGNSVPKSSAGVIKQISYTSQTDSIPVAPRSSATSPHSPNREMGQPSLTTPRTALEPVPPSAPLPLAPVPKNDTAKAAGPDKDGGYVTSGIILVNAEESPVPVPVSGKGNPSPAHLKKRIESVCGKTVRGVEVVPQGPGSVLVRLKARTAEEAKRASEKVLAMPEVAPPFQVQLQTTVEP